MGNRISKVTTKTGDDGTTAVSGNHRMSKASARINAIGSIDEANSAIGVVWAHLEDDNPVGIELEAIQNTLFNVGGELSFPEYQSNIQEDIEHLEILVNEMNEALPPLKDFILPRGNKEVAFCHVARTVVRRAERDVVALNAQEEVRPELISYLNRLSDYLFVTARWLSDDQEQLWTKSEV